MTKEKLKLVIRERNKQRLIRAHRRWSYQEAIESLRAKGYFAIKKRGVK